MFVFSKYCHTFLTDLMLNCKIIYNFNQSFQIPSGEISTKNLRMIEFVFHKFYKLIWQYVINPRPWLKKKTLDCQCLIILMFEISVQRKLTRKMGEHEEAETFVFLCMRTDFFTVKTLRFTCLSIRLFRA